MKYNKIPPQKKSFSQKQSFEGWQKPTIDGYIDHCVFMQDEEFKQNLIENYDLDAGKLSPEAVEKYSNPFGLKGQLSPAKLQHYQSSSIRIDLLVGEEIQRKLEHSVLVTNQNAISSKLNTLKELLFEKLMAIGMNEEDSEQTKTFKIRKLEEWAKYNYKDAVEIAGSRLLNKVMQDVETPVIFNRCYRDLLIGGLEVGHVETIGEKLFARRVNPLNLYYIPAGDSQYIDEAEAIMEVNYYPPGQVIDFYQDVLKPSDIDKIWDKNKSGEGTSTNAIKYNFVDGYEEIIFANMEDYNSRRDAFRDYLNGAGASFNEYGEVRVIRLVWASFRQIKMLTYFDPETGDELSKVVDEYYEPNIELGETVKVKWIREYWKATKILDDIYVNVGPIPIQIKGNGYVGTFSTIDGYTIRSLMDRMKPFEYLYDVFLYRTELAFTKSFGNVATLDTAKKPSWMSYDQWLYYIINMNLNIEDSFNSASEGEATGKIAGNISAPRGTISADSSGVIQQSMAMLQYLDDTLSSISGVTRQRLGQIESRDTVGGTERAIRQSSSQTEHWFFIHDKFKERFLNLLLYSAIHLYKDKKELMHNFMDDGSMEIIEFVGSDLLGSGLEVKVVSSRNEEQIKNLLHEYSFAALQGDKVLFSDAMRVYRSNSNAERIKILEQSEETLRMQQQQAAQQAQEAQEALQDKIFEQQVVLKQMEIDARFGEKGIDTNRDGIADNVELEKERLSNEVEVLKIAAQERMNREKIAADERMNKEDNITKIKTAMKKAIK